MSVDFSEKQSIGELRKCCQEWKRYFPEKYSQNQWFIDVIWLRSNVKQALEIFATRPRIGPTQTSATGLWKWEKTATRDSSQFGHRKGANGIQLQAQVERYMCEIADQVQSLIGRHPSAATAIDLAGMKLMLSSREADAFQQPSEGVGLGIQRAVAIRAILLTAMDKPGVIDLCSAAGWAQSEALAFEEQVAAVKKAGDMDAAMNLAACVRSLQKILEKMNSAKLPSGANLSGPHDRQLNQQPKPGET